MNTIACEWPKLSFVCGPVGELVPEIWGEGGQVMRCRRIIIDPFGKTFPGGECMAKIEIKLGDVSYQLSRVFIGSRTASELLIDHVVDRVREDVAVDAAEKPAV